MKYIYLLIGLVSAIFILQQGYLFTKYSGNLLIHVNNFTYAHDQLNEPLNFNIYIDGELAFNDTLSASGFGAFKFYSIKRIPRKHLIEIELDNGQRESLLSSVFPIKFFVIDIYETAQLSSNTITNKDRFKINISTRYTSWVLE